MPIVPIRGLSRVSDIERAAARAKEAIGRVPGAALDLPKDALDKLRWLEHGGRDFREVNNVMKREVNGAFADALKKVLAGKAPVTLPWHDAAEAYRDVLAKRLATSGGDVKAHMKALKPDTVARKGHARIGVDKGDLLREVATAKVRVTRG